MAGGNIEPFSDCLIPYSVKLIRIVVGTVQIASSGKRREMPVLDTKKGGGKSRRRQSGKPAYDQVSKLPIDTHSTISKCDRRGLVILDTSGPERTILARVD